MLWEEYNLTKYNKGNTIILDDYDEVYIPTANCVVAEAFEFTDEGSEYDSFLPKLIPKLEKARRKC